MKKILGLVVILGLLAIPAHASDNSSDNITIPNTFNSGATISSSQMNENFLKLVQKINELQTTINNLTPNFIKISTGNCGTNGYKYILTIYECALALGDSNTRIFRESVNVSKPPGCHNVLDNGEIYWQFNVHQDYNKTLDGSTSTEMWCKQ